MAKITTTGLAVLTALRAASVLTREPGTLTPDGHRKFFTIAELEEEGRLDGIEDVTGLSRAARGLYKNGYVAVRTQFTVTRWAITAEGLLALAGVEAEAGVSEAVALLLDLDQALYDLDRARRRVDEANTAYFAAKAALGRDIPSLVAGVLAR